jgi:hypothetical protein
MKRRAHLLRSRGYTLLEAMVVLGITTMVIVILAAVQKDILSLDTIVHGAFSAQGDARKAFRAAAKEVRAANYAENGSYPVAVATTTSFAFYSDIDSDGETERVRYFISGDDLRRGVIEPSGSPATYTGTETLTTLASDVDNAGAPVFEYFDASYDGTGSPLASPPTLSDIRLVRITVIIDKNGDRTPEPQTYSTQLVLRNLKDNL